MAMESGTLLTTVGRAGVLFGKAWPRLYVAMFLVLRGELPFHRRAVAEGILAPDGVEPGNEHKPLDALAAPVPGVLRGVQVPAADRPRPQ
ncbi:hypothetical protein [Kribbella rubisoli]|uniref:hypothetical protein n=1 Tax=Kribbella rubisoli TaxID=3075929 RepID=UPI0018E56F15|nr:hypothetical protein [Kribbella rubisoli]